jgi:hypothetical protein
MDRYFPILRCPRGNEMVVLTPALMFSDRDAATRIADGHFSDLPTWSWVLAGEWRPTGEVLEAVGGSAGRPVVYADYPCDSLSGTAVSVALLAGPDFDAAPSALASPTTQAAE